MAWKYRKLLANIGNVLQALLGDTTGAEDLQKAVEAEARVVLRLDGRRAAPGAGVDSRRRTGILGFLNHDMRGPEQ